MAEADTGVEHGDALVVHGGAADHAEHALVQAAETHRALPAPRPASTTPTRVLHWALRGRYVLAVVLGLFAGAVCGVVGYKLQRPVYRSEGLVRIAYSLPQIMGPSEQNQPLGQMFDTLLQSQRQLITSRKVIDKAATDTLWQGTSAKVPADLVQFYAEQLKVDVRPRSEFIIISVSDSDPVLAASAVTAIINAYSSVYHDQEKDVEKARQSALETRRLALQGQLNTKTNQLDAAAREYGSTHLDAFYEAAAERLRTLEMALAQVRLAMAAADVGAPATQPSTPQVAAAPVPEQPTSRPVLTPEQISANDQTMRNYLDEQARIESELKRLAAMGLKSEHKDVKLARMALDNIKTRIATYAQLRNDNPLAPAVAPGQPTGSGAVVVTGRTFEQLKANETSLLRLQKDAKQEMAALGNKRLELQRLETEIAALKEDMTLIDKRTQSLQAESAIGGRLSVVSYGGIPVVPERDPRLRLAGAGALAGASLPAGLILLMSLVWRKYRYSDETEADIGSAPLLGILPELKSSGGDSDQNVAAAHSVHQIRVALQSRAIREGGGPRLYLVTSATAGEGKTTLATSLAMSFAASRLRTLLVDADLVGRHLTDALGARDVEGLHEAISAGSVRRRVRRTDAGLYVLPAGKASAPDASALASHGAREMIGELRQYFDVIVIDTGPILGSLEAAVLAQEADGVIMTITRGQNRELVQKAMSRLETLHARVMGFVFNRARSQDFHRSAYGSPSQPPVDAAADTAPMVEPQSLMRFGPVVRAVASGLRPARESTVEA